MRVVMILVVMECCQLWAQRHPRWPLRRCSRLNAGYYLGGPQKRSIQEGKSKSLRFNDVFNYSRMASAGHDVIVTW